MRRSHLGRRRAGVAALAVGIGAWLSSAPPAGAHGVGGRADLPLPVWLFAYSAAFALLISFVALRILWPRPRLAAAAAGRALPEATGPVVRVAVVVARTGLLVLYAATLVATWIGPDSVYENLAPTAFYVAFWVGVPLATALGGSFWHEVGPLATLGRLIDRAAGRAPGEDRSTGIAASHWPAAITLGAFLWLELAYHEPGAVPAVGAFLTIHAVVALAGAARYGSGWLRHGDGFTVLFDLLGTLSPLHRAADGRLRVRLPGSGLSTIVPRDGTAAVVLVLLGGTAFDGFGRTQWWSDVVGTRRGWEATIVHSIGLALVVGSVSVAFAVACRLVGRGAGDDEATVDATTQLRRWLPSLVPIVLAYSIAHYFSLLVYEGQNFVALLSDPFGKGWDLFGTASNAIDYTVLTPNQIAYVQVAAIVGGHVAGVVAAHDRAVELYDERTATRSQYPMLVVMVLYTVGGLFLLLNA